MNYLQRHLSSLSIGVFVIASLIGAPLRAQSPGYVTGQDLIQSFDPATGQVLDSFTSAAAFVSTAVSKDGGTLYVPFDDGAGGQQLQVVSTATGGVLSAITGLTTGPNKVVLSPNGKWAYVQTNGDGGGGAVDVVNLASGKVVAVIAFPSGYPVDIALSPDGTRLYASKHRYGASAQGAKVTSESTGLGPSCPVSQGLCVFNTSNLAIAGQISGLVGYLAVSQDGKSLYAWYTSPSIVVINTTTLALSKIATPQGFIGTSGVFIAPTGSTAIIYGAQNQSNIIPYVLNTQTNKDHSCYAGPSSRCGSERLRQQLCILQPRWKLDLDGRELL